MKGGGFKVRTTSQRCGSAVRKQTTQQTPNELMILDMYQTNTNNFITPRSNNNSKQLIIRNSRPSTGAGYRKLDTLKSSYKVYRLTDKSKQSTRCQLETIIDSLLKKTTTNTTLEQVEYQKIEKKDTKPPMYNLLKKSQSGTSTLKIKRSNSQICEDAPNDIDRYHVLQTLGSGSYATVKLARDKASEKLVAIKIYQKQKLYNPQRKQALKREIHILKLLDHPNIISFIQTFETGNEIHLVSEYGGGMSLRTYLKQFPNRKLEEDEAKFIFRQVVKAVFYCHSQDIVHRDIKLENILLKDSNQVKLIDFGFSVIVHEETKLSVFCGTPSYMAPELVNKNEYYGKPVDSWALGVLLYVLLQGFFPFKGKDDTELFSNIKRGQYKIPNVSTNCQKLVAQMLTIRASERITVSRIISDRWLNS